MNTFDESIKLVDNIYAEQLKKLPELTVKLNEKFASVRKQEHAVYDILQAIIAREGGDKVSFKDGGRTCFITPLEEDRIKIEYQCDFNSTTKLKDAIITKEEPTVSDDPIEDFDKLSREFTDLERYAAVVDLAQKVIDAYVSYQNSLSNYRTTLVEKIMGEKDEESYW